ncbi:MAG TPA: hypothetical protein VGO47_02305 [Chlamydiales bacterium]|nr:hypothetical protein [Chlamydiales bacterium]
MSRLDVIWARAAFLFALQHFGGCHPPDALATFRPQLEGRVTLLKELSSLQMSSSTNDPQSPI